MISKQKGFSLIEVMIAFLLIGISSLGLVKLHIYVEQRADFSLHSIEALHLAENKLEWFRTRGASSALSSMTLADFSTDIIDGQDTSHSFYTLRWSVPSVSLSGALKSIDIEVSWFDRQGEKQSVKLQTMLSAFSEFD
ncbi:type IV pilus modification PilV family protein [Vibrio aestuarianus]|uniref:Prepilin-type N-terminal cleavage/methylation domain-containing protein n=1 Tax=Vibrio aestuarianus TaxID=28171 RepID=A0A9X4J0D7_9VIBR|nr:prepilin-type N-terminal cleavage/methylation domain-containing protein [Vibrio aestuarianus]KOE83012.1 type IV pilin [Vibrio alginolyticus]MDE1234703.1 prepilin-type N-terminal cleavage/methylation domain-containing protein [Vibrio aestuarianus]MDE1245517.1 prepilin-type N-terminal cleavage/methylation domain-containing protein [Vibrio aestuarianus]MDE1346517.1 prepilin-type N-terminal cleavage/methylation domain-containing protein [Vibrio aestuarianus]NGZ62784.1 prepilin-type N-terminal c